jgi:hypothetical protein
MNLYLSYLIKNSKESAIDSTITHVFYNYVRLTLDTKLSEAVDAGNSIEIILNEK